MSLIDVKNLTFSYDGSFDNVFENVSFQIDTDWKIGFTGRNGRGKTTFLKLLMGSYEYTGTINSSVNFEYFPFEVENTALNGIEIAESLYSDFMLWELEYELNKLETDSEILYRPFSTLSKGEQTKLMLAGIRFSINEGVNGTGMIGFTDELGFDMYVSNQLSNSGGIYRCLAGSYSSIAYAEQVLDTQVIDRMESCFATAVRGRLVFGAKVIRPDELVCAPLSDGENAIA